MSYQWNVYLPGQWRCTAQAMQSMTCRTVMVVLQINTAGRWGKAMSSVWIRHTTNVNSICEAYRWCGYWKKKRIPLLPQMLELELIIFVPWFRNIFIMVLLQYDIYIPLFQFINTGNGIHRFLGILRKKGWLDLRLSSFGFISHSAFIFCSYLSNESLLITESTSSFPSVVTASCSKSLQLRNIISYLTKNSTILHTNFKFYVVTDYVSRNAQIVKQESTHNTTVINLSMIVDVKFQITGQFHRPF